MIPLLRFWRGKAPSALPRRGWPKGRRQHRSLYQYFPNKAAILFRLQSDEWRETTGLLATILENGQRSPLDRLRRLVHAFLRSECEEAAMRAALHDAVPLYRDAPEAQAARASGDRIVELFMREALPSAPESTRAT
ncbi:AcrR family transcriptional regulator [Rhizobium lentis]|uniref:AcrR family transcriptional regulator n=1 Tax=Rhizobium lentis TaxID=1138194 RepID=A0A7W8UIP5_9HYPH|nr:AcrR family transcriptional regulator [Rhizobium lentis]MBB5548206.1 AcrR family transcriptional regulator [Rhizobium lentis]MBB5558734.1 AcrR family transcriptional regulator [Rhizobium lentis]MBB5565742.1 AcrR family transcriptional regulator [Rhizobium lentis]